MMNKTLLWAVVILAVLASCFGAYADEQSEVTVRDKATQHVAFQYGPQLNLRLSGIGSYAFGRKYGNGDNGYGIGAGFYGRVLLTPKWYMASCISFNYDYAPLTLNSNYEEGGEPYWQKYRLDSMTMDIPLHAGYRFRFSDDLHFSVFLGASATYFITGDLYGPSTLPAYDSFGEKGILKRTSLNGDFGWTTEIEGRALVSITGKLGMRDISKRNIFGYNSMYFFNLTIGAVFLL